MQNNQELRGTGGFISAVGQVTIDKGDIGAVAKVTLTSRKKGATDGAELAMNAGKMGKVKPASNPVGTIVEVRDLFHAVPVRRKFLRSPEVELEHVEEGVVREALAHPDVRFELSVEGERRRLLPAAKDLRERIALCFGKELADALVEIKAETPHASFTAYAAPPKYEIPSVKKTRHSKRDQRV